MNVILRVAQTSETEFDVIEKVNETDGYFEIQKGNENTFYAISENEIFTNDNVLVSCFDLTGEITQIFGSVNSPFQYELHFKNSKGGDVTFLTPCMLKFEIV